MADWANALASGLAAGAKAGVDIIDTNMKASAAADAEQRAADLKLDTNTRMLAIEDAMKTRAAERFSGVVKDKMGDQVPVEAAPVSKTGLTRESAGDFEVEPGKVIGANFQQSPEQVKAILAQAQGTVDNPNATDQQRADARDLMAAITAQSEAQAGTNALAVKGKTRARTSDEAQTAALDDTLQNDAPAFIAGTGMLNTANKQDMEQKRLDSREKIARAESDRKERTASAALDQKDRAAELRYDAMIERIDALGSGGKAGSKSALRQNVELLKELGFGPDKIEKFIFDKKEISEEDLTAKIMASDKFGDMTVEQAAAKAKAIKSAATPSKPPGGTAPKTLTYDPTTRTFK